MNPMILANIGNIDYTKTLDFISAIQFGGMILLIGMVTVFLVLFILWLTLLLFKFVFHDLTITKKSKATPKVIEVAPAKPALDPNELEVIAALSAAIAAAESESDGIKFRVVSFRKR